MPKRKLSKKQTRQVGARRQKKISNASNQSSNLDTQDLPTEQIGPEQSGIVIAYHGAFAEVENTDNECRQCHVRANIDSLVAGDNVIWRDGKPNGVVEAVLDRNSEIYRPDSYGHLRVVAANVNQMLITVAPKPEPHENLIDRYLVSAHSHNIDPVIILNKSDLLEPFNRDALLKISNSYRKLGYQVIHISTKSREGVDELEAILRDKTSIFVGQSGVGKSSLVKMLLPEQDVKIGELSDAAIKGKHTTTHSRLFHFNNGGTCIDSPGIREFGLWHIDKHDLIRGFIEINEHAALCKFRNCSHNQEPGCAVKKAVKNGQISPRRFASYQQILRSLDDVTIKNKS